MAYTLKTTGLAAIAVSIVALDEDGTIRDFVDADRTATMTVDAGVTLGASTWKGTSRGYFETFRNGGYDFTGVRFDAAKKVHLDAGYTKPGIGTFIAFAGADIDTASDVSGILADSGSALVRTRFGKSAQQWSSDYVGTTTLPAGGATKFSIGTNIVYGGAWSNVFGLESGSLAVDGSGTDGGGTDAIDVQYVGGWPGYGAAPAKYHLASMFPRPLTLVERQSLHDDWFGVLFDVVADTTAPTLTSPTGTKTGSTTATGSVSTDKAGGTLSAIVSTSATQPSVAQIKAGQNAAGAAAVYATSRTVTATGVQSFAATGLTASTAYYWHYQQVDAAATPNNSTVVTSLGFTTDAPNTPPTFSGTIADISGTQGTALTNVDVASYFTDTDALTYSKVGAWPAGATLTGSVIGGTPSSTGTFANLKVRATDTAAQTVDSNAFTISLSPSADTTMPTMTGSISVPVGPTSTSYTISWSAATDNVGVAGYEYSLNGGTSWTDLGNVLFKAVTGRTPGATDAVRVRAYDASGNKATPLSASVTLLAGGAAATLTLPVLKNNTGTVLANEAGATVHVYALTGELIVTKTGQATSGLGIMTVSDAAMVSGTQYRIIIKLASGAEGMDKVTAT